MNTVIARVIDIKANETILLTYHVIVKELGNLTNLVTVGNNTDNNTIEVLPTADVAINISMPDKATVGDEVQVNITVTNYGPSDAENVVAKWIIMVLLMKLLVIVMVLVILLMVIGILVL